MTTDELIAKLLDGTLSASEHQELQTLIASSPELADEIHNLTAIEQMLSSQPVSPIVEESRPFLHTVENTIAANLAAQSKAPLIGTKTAMWLATVPFAVLLGGVAFSLFQPSEMQVSPAQRAAEAPPTLHIELPASTTPKAVLTPQSTPQASAVRRAQRTTSAPAVQTQEPNNSQAPAAAHTPSLASVETPSADIQGSARITSPSKPAIRIESYRKQFEQFLQDGNKVQAAITAKTLGVLQRQAGNTAEARESLLSALRLSREVRLTEYEAETLGELGLLAKATGNVGEARTYLRSCIALLESSPDAALLGRWHKELQNIE